MYLSKLFIVGAAMKMKMADGSTAVLRRNRPGTKAEAFDFYLFIIPDLMMSYINYISTLYDIITN